MQHKTLYIDCFAGIAGDMMLGALIDLGVPEAVIQDGLKQLGLETFTLTTKRSSRHGIEGCDVQVLDHSHTSPKMTQPGVSHTHTIEPASKHAHHHHEEDHHSHGSSRNWKDIRALLQSASLPGSSGKKALEIFERLAVAEATIHGVSPESVHFHEVGGVDAIVDIVGTAVALDWLAPTAIKCAPVPVPRGFVSCDHGRMPLPAPATFELLRSAHVTGVEHNGEWVTPTGAAILATVVDSYGHIPAFRPTAIGYGIGDRDTSTHANVLRLVLGEPNTGSYTTEEITQLEATLDDMIPEWYGALTDSLRDKGALDCWLTPVQMKKGRPGTQVTVLCPTHLAAQFIDIIFRESTTLGIRIQTVNRVVAERQIVSVETSYGRIRMKVGSHNGISVNIAPEYEDCLAASEAHRVPIKDVYIAALRQYESK